MFPKKLSAGDEVRVIAPARSMSIISPAVRSIALKRLKEMGLKVSFSKHCEERDAFDSSSVKSRLEDIHEAFSDKKVAAILTTIGGCNSIHLLKELDYKLLRKNPKIICGYSDISTLQNAVFAQTGLVTYSGPHFSTFGCLQGIDYVVDSFQKCLFNGEKELSLTSSSSWSDDEWYLDQEKRKFMPNEGYIVLQTGEAAGTIVGGNIDSFTVLQGTEYMPSLKNKILFLEDNDPMTADILDRHIHSLILQSGFKHVKGIVLGRFQVASKITKDLLEKIIHSKKELNDIPVVAQADFGHTLPLFTFPIGGEVRLESKPSGVKLTLTRF
ncbi:MAG: LD-carboxypeptidase [Verrucomicrobia bacterium]|nr:LD-carboxypeptidase [Verrucomicrobiota bacterium]